MSAPYTLTSLVRCRVKDLASCFYACRFPSEQEQENFGSISPQMNRTGNCKKQVKKIRGENNGTSVQISRSGSGIKADGDSRRWPRFAEEDYIVFCFGDDGGIYVMNEGNDLIQGFDETSVGLKGNGKGNDNAWPLDEIKEINPVEDPITPKTDSFESCDSNASDTSSSSFAFPVLGIEWLGSPVQMPKTEKLKPRSVLHCCRF